jgi:hypothetical protein
MRTFKGIALRALQKLPWLLVLFVLEIPRKLLEDRMSGWLNRELDMHGGRIMASLSNSAIFLLYHPWLIVVLAVVIILFYSLVTERAQRPPASAKYPGKEIWSSLKSAGLVSVLLLAVLGVTRGCDQPGRSSTNTTNSTSTPEREPTQPSSPDPHSIVTETIVLTHDFDFPAFVTQCNVPCSFVRGTVFGIDSKVEALPQQDQTIAGAKIVYPIRLKKGQKIVLEYASKSGGPISLKWSDREDLTARGPKSQSLPGSPQQGPVVLDNFSGEGLTVGIENNGTQPLEVKGAHFKDTGTGYRQDRPGTAAPPPPAPPSGEGAGAVGTVTAEPCSSVQVGGIGNASKVDCGPPPPKIMNMTEEVMAAIPQFSVPADAPDRNTLAMQYNNSLGPERGHPFSPTWNPGLRVSFQVSSTFEDPKFDYRCDHPCIATSISTGGISGDGYQQRVWRDLGLPTVLTTDVTVTYTFRSKDFNNPVTIVTITPHIPKPMQP